jgi:hypothetical protein
METRGILSFFNTPDGQGRLPKNRKKKRNLNYLPYRFWFRPNPEESSDSHHRIGRTSRAVQQARLDVQASGWELLAAVGNKGRSRKERAAQKRLHGDAAVAQEEQLMGLHTQSNDDNDQRMQIYERLRKTHYS